MAIFFPHPCCDFYAAGGGGGGTGAFEKIEDVVNSEIIRYYVNVIHRRKDKNVWDLTWKNYENEPEWTSLMQ